MSVLCQFTENSVFLVLTLRLLMSGLLRLDSGNDAPSVKHLTAAVEDLFLQTEGKSVGGLRSKAGECRRG